MRASDGLLREGGDMPGNAWTDDGVTLLRKLWAEGATAAAIGRRLGGLSRSAVLGKIFRLRLNGEGGGRGRSEQAPKQRDALGRRRRRQPRQRSAARPPPKPAERLTLLELTNESCRWPAGRAGRFFFCGVAEADLQRGIPYCPRHMRRAYTETVSFKKPERGDFAGTVTSPKIGAAA
jgi:GcrA cell cycle regulator